MKIISPLNWSIEPIPCRFNVFSIVFSVEINNSFENIINQEESKVSHTSLSLSSNESSFYWIDYQGNPWKVNEQTGKRERVNTYKVNVAAVFGETTICSNEKQVRLFFSFICPLNESSRIDHRLWISQFSLYHWYGSEKRRDQIRRCILRCLSLLSRANCAE